MGLNHGTSLMAHGIAAMETSIAHCGSKPTVLYVQMLPVIKS
ncbi:hypothetical protein [Clostridium sp. DSM 17811]|nr:hypothetical protein [Clostridium sp. DSM 17811]